MSTFSVCATLYGEHLPLAAKLLESLSVNAHVKDIRLGLNSVSHETTRYVHEWAREQMKIQPVYLFEPADSRNVGKYPLMRQMFHYPGLAEKIMWFDDDSYVDAAAGPDWWDTAYTLARCHIQVGAIHFIPQRGLQYKVIQQQPWFTGKVVSPRHRYEFITGGWWVGDSAFLNKWDYPFPDLYHNGGDSILGELIRQQGIKLGKFRSGIQCHCESCSNRGIEYGKPVVHVNVGGRKGRRGIGTTGENYVWSDGNPAPVLDHQNFDLGVYRYEN